MSGLKVLVGLSLVSVALLAPPASAAPYCTPPVAASACLYDGGSPGCGYDVLYLYTPVANGIAFGQSCGSNGYVVAYAATSNRYVYAVWAGGCIAAVTTGSSPVGMCGLPSSGAIPFGALP